MTKFTVSSTFIKSSLKQILLTISLSIIGTSSTLAATIRGTLTADIHYGLYYGKADGSELTFVGRNEQGLSGNPGLYSWSLPETFSFSPKPGDYLYVFPWDGLDPFVSWIGEFELPGGVSLLSNSTDWEYTIASGINPGGNGEAPSPTELTTKIAGATWTAPKAVGSNGSAPWGTIPNISSSAQFLDWPASNTDSAIFRTKEPVISESEPVPEPSSVLGVLVFGAFGAAFQRKRKRQQKANNSNIN